MDFIVPITVSFILAPKIGLAYAFIYAFSRSTFLALKRRPYPKKLWENTFAVFGVCTCLTPPTLLIGFAISLDMVTRKGNEIAISTSKEFWKEFASIERELHDVKSGNEPAYQKMNRLVDKYLWPTSVVVGASHDGVRELSFNEVKIGNVKPRVYPSNLITSQALISTPPAEVFNNWMIGSGFTKPYDCDSVYSYRRSGPKKYYAKDVLFHAYRTKKRINVDIYTDIEISRTRNNDPPVTEFLKSNLGGQLFYLVLGDVKFHSLSGKNEYEVQPINKIHQAFIDLLSESELKSLEASVTDNICVQSLSWRDSQVHRQYDSPYLRAPISEAPRTFN